VNCSNVVNSTTTTAILPGSGGQYYVSPNWAPTYVAETNFTIEQPLKGNSVLRVSWVWTHSTNLDIAPHPNNDPTTFEWEMSHGVIPPTGGASVIGTPQQNTYSATATGPYNQTNMPSDVSLHIKEGWMNDNSLQVNYQRLFHHGVAYQIYYIFSKDLRLGGDQQANTSLGLVDPYANYPGAEGTVATMTSPYGRIGSVRVAPRPLTCRSGQITRPWIALSFTKWTPPFRTTTSNSTVSWICPLGAVNGSSGTPIVL
jgi:hypothetical protein